MQRDTFEHIRTLLRQRSGQNLEEGKSYLVETRLLPIARQAGVESVDALAVLLRREGNERLIEQVIEAMAINETLFFRDAAAFAFLQSHILPTLLRRRSKEKALSIWSAACSSGQEPYSVALVLREGFPEVRSGWQVRLVGSDLSAAMLARARHGEYSPLEVSRGLPPEVLHRYFRQVGSNWRLCDTLRHAVEFLPINLLHPWPALPPLDLVLLRNVLIYFDVPTRAQILSRIRRLLRPDGYLMLGGAETTTHLDPSFEPVPGAPGSFFQIRATGP